MKTVVLKVGRKGILILPKEVRESIGVKEGDEVVVNVEDDTLVLKRFKVKRVRVSRKLIDKLLREELALEEAKFEDVVKR